MLLLTEQPDCCQQFTFVADFIDRIFEYAENASNRPFNAQSFRDHFGPEGEWYLSLSDSDKGPVRKGLLALFSKIEPDEVGILRKVVTNDTTFYQRLNDENFCFQVQSLPEHLVEVLKGFIGPFYSNIFCKGGFKNITRLQISGLNRDMYIEEYKEKNTDRWNVCPACLGDVQGFEESMLVENEHYFPKKRYPSLAVSPHNLIPICSDCNSPAIHGTTDPILAHEPGAIKKVFLPYYRTGMDNLKLKFSFINGKFKVEIKANDETDLILVQQVGRLNTVYKLETQWCARINTHFDLILDRLREHKEEENIEESLKSFLTREAKLMRKRRYKTADAFWQATFYLYLRDEYFDHILAQL